MKVVPIVEGQGDVEAVPVLLRRLVAEAGVPAAVGRAIRVPRGRTHTNECVVLWSPSTWNRAS